MTPQAARSFFSYAQEWWRSYCAQGEKADRGKAGGGRAPFARRLVKIFARDEAGRSLPVTTLVGAEIGGGQRGSCGVVVLCGVALRAYGRLDDAM